MSSMQFVCRAHLLFDLHKEIDGLREEELAGGKIGTTRRGIGPAYASKAQRNGVRVGELRDMSNFANKLRRLVLSLLFPACPDVLISVFEACCLLFFGALPACLQQR